MAGPQDPVAADIARIRRQVDQRIDAAIAEARRTGKQVLFIIGEQHGTTNGALFESLIYSELNRRNLNQVGIEVGNGDNVHLTKVTRGEPEGMTLVAGEAMANHDRIRGIDPLYDSTVASTRAGRNPSAVRDARNRAMAGSIADTRGPLLVIVGRDHMPGIAADPRLTSSRTIVTFDVTDARTGPTPRLAAPPGTMHLQLQSDPRELSLERIVTLSMGDPAAARSFLASNGQGTIQSPAERNASMARAQAMLRANPRDPAGLRILSEGLYSQGRDADAGRLAADYANAGPQATGDMAIVFREDVAYGFFMGHDAAYRQAFAAELSRLDSPRTPPQPRTPRQRQ